ncbi:LytTR family DNA-binding domain-containing protein [Tateyamaria sp.]|uniref:LytTR family DNA-binding domain-containing protein n=1 Tax=Tateyamaria sp. TaxID=1929288 RepID=UPI0032A01016
MSDSYPQSALREWRAHMGHPATLVAILGVGLVLGVAGPFGTDVRLALLPRIAYWLITVLLTYSVGTLCDAMLKRPLARFGFWVHLAVTALATGVAILLVLLVVNYIVYGWLPDRDSLPAFLGTNFAIAIIVSVVLATVHRQSTPAEVVSNPVRILDRLPLDKRGPLVALSVEDHYVRVQTTHAEDLILMRLSDAIQEVGDTKGTQVHRSHWAAFEHVTTARREGDRAILTMRTGTDIPVSRANVAKIKEAGLLP